MTLLTLTNGAINIIAPAARIARLKARLSDNWIAFPSDFRAREIWRNRGWDCYFVEAA